MCPRPVPSYLVPKIGSLCEILIQLFGQFFRKRPGVKESDQRGPPGAGIMDTKAG
jgi:hypothetical protein